MTDFQHCPACATEYVAGVPVCADCGGPLSAGALPDPPPDVYDSPRAASVPGPTPDMKLAELPGLQADFAVRALTMEGIVCGVECAGIRKVHLPDRPPHEPLAVTLPVSIYVPAGNLSEAQAILRSLEPPDVIGSQWESAGIDEVEDDVDDSPPARHFPDLPPADSGEVLGHGGGAPRRESTTGRLLLVLAAAACAVYFLSR